MNAIYGCQTLPLDMLKKDSTRKTKSKTKKKLDVKQNWENFLIIKSEEPDSSTNMAFMHNTCDMNLFLMFSTFIGIN